MKSLSHAILYHSYSKSYALQMCLIRLVNVSTIAYCGHRCLFCWLSKVSLALWSLFLLVFDRFYVCCGILVLQQLKASIRYLNVSVCSNQINFIILCVSHDHIFPIIQSISKCFQTHIQDKGVLLCDPIWVTSQFSWYYFIQLIHLLDAISQYLYHSPSKSFVLQVCHIRFVNVVIFAWWGDDRRTLSQVI